MKRRTWPVLLFLLATLRPAQAHESRPGYLQIDITGQSATVVWKQPTLGDVAVRMEPRLSNGWLDALPTTEYLADAYLIRTWRVRAATMPDLADVTVHVDGLADTLTDVLVRVSSRGQPDWTAILNPNAPSRLIREAGSGTSTMAFLQLGGEHILGGPDHLLFVMGLLLLVGRRLGSLIRTVTAFTVAHSLTLALAALGHVRVNLPFVDTLIAVSILLLAVEIVRARRGQHSLTLHSPWLAAFAFGLFHGLGFASGLASVQMEGAAALHAIAFFNVGVEIAQLAFIAVLLAARALIDRVPVLHLPALRIAPVYALGGLGMFWILQRGSQLFTAL